MSRLASTDFDLIRGDTFVKRVTIQDASGGVLDVSAWTFAGQVRADPDDPDPPLAEFTFDLADAEQGTIELTLAAADTETFTTRFVAYDIQATTDEDQVRTILFGRLNIIPDVTR